MLENALRYPWNGEQNLETLLIGGILSLLGVFFIPILFVYGYLVRVIRQVSAGDDELPPVFDEWGDLLVDGFIAFVISLVYFLVPAVIIAAGTLAWILPVSVGASVGGQSGGGIAVFGFLLALVVGLVGLLTLLAALYLVPAAVGAFARTGEFSSAFSPSQLREIGSDQRYAVAWLIAIAIGILAQVVGSVVGATIIGLLLVPFITFYGNVASAYAIGQGIGDAAPTTEQADDTTAGQPAV